MEIEQLLAKGAEYVNDALRKTPVSNQMDFCEQLAEHIDITTLLEVEQPHQAHICHAISGEQGHSGLHRSFDVAVCKKFRMNKGFRKNKRAFEHYEPNEDGSAKRYQVPFGRALTMIRNFGDSSSLLSQRGSCREWSYHEAKLKKEAAAKSEAKGKQQKK